MQILFTPWRFRYLTAPRSEQACIFCIGSSTEDPASSLVLYRNTHALVMLNRYPYTTGHLMVAPASHVAQLHESSPVALHVLIRLAAESQRILSSVYRPDGFNVGMNFGTAGGAGFADHYHLHIVPRWTGDTNFMTITAETRMVPESIEQTWDRLREAFVSVPSEFSV